MATFVRLNDVTYELASQLDDQQAKQLAEHLKAKVGDQIITVRLPDKRTVTIDLHIDLSKVWASGVANHEGGRVL